MTLPRKTRSAAALIGATVAQIMAAIYNGKLTPPGKDESGDYIWTDEDLERARAALAVDRRRKPSPETPRPQLKIVGGVTHHPPTNGSPGVFLDQSDPRTPVAGLGRR